MKPLALAALLLAPLIGCASGCSDRDRGRREPARDPQRERRVIEPPVGIVRALPPHAIRSDGVGPYRLGEKLSSLLEQLPSGPRIALFEIPGLLHRSLIRAEDDAVLIGGEPGGTATAVAIVDPEVARTESGIHVGSTREDVVRVIGPLVVEPHRARDPRLAVAAGLPHARLIFEGDRIAAISITAAPPGLPALEGGREAVASPGCVRPPAPDKAIGKAVGQLIGQVIGACVTGAGELVYVDGNEVSLRPPGSERVIASLRVPGTIEFAAPLRVTEQRDELAVVTHSDKDQVRSWSLSVYRLEGGRLRATVEPALLYQLSSANARWIGADLSEVGLYLELTGGPGAIEVGGLLTTRQASGTGFRDVVVISPVSVPRRPVRAPGPGPVDAGVDAVDASGASGGSSASGGASGASTVDSGAD